MNKLQKDAIYDEMCHLITDYEVALDNEFVVDPDDFYEFLVRLQNNWEELTSEK